MVALNELIAIFMPPALFWELFWYLFAVQCSYKDSQIACIGPKGCLFGRLLVSQNAP